MSLCGLLPFSREALSGYVQVNGTDWYYEARFWDGMPDLNLENEAVRREFEQIADFWLDMGVDGFRLDAVKEYVTGSTEDNVEILSWFADYVHGKIRRIIWCVNAGRIRIPMPNIMRAAWTACLILLLPTSPVSLPM